MSARAGIGYDSHALVEGRPCILGGVRIPHPSGPLGHSDGDAVLHAIADALLGAAGLDDIGTRFPDSDPRWKGADSARLLAEVVEKVRATGFDIVNVDVVVIADAPKIAPHRDAMRKRIGELLGIDATAVNVKGKTCEGLPLAMRGAYVAVHAVCSIE